MLSRWLWTQGSQEFSKVSEVVVALISTTIDPMIDGILPGTVGLWILPLQLRHGQKAGIVGVFCDRGRTLLEALKAIRVVLCHARCYI